MRNIFNMVMQGCFPIEWTTSVVIPLHKSGDVNNASNYHTIMVNPLLNKLYGSGKAENQRMGKIKKEKSYGTGRFRTRTFHH